MGIRFGYVVLGGLTAGVVINVCEFLVNGFFLKDEWAQAMRALGKPETQTASQIAVFNIWGFAMGILLVWMYAAMRPRFGPGVRTAVIAAATLWLSGYFLSMVPPLVMNMFPVRLVAISLTVGLVEVVFGALAGCAVYKEERPADGLERQRAATA
jgi:hypothetical protein